MRRAFPLLAIPLLVLTVARAQAFDIAFSGYLDARLIAPTEQQSWVKGGQGKFRFGGGDGNARLVEGVARPMPPCWTACQPRSPPAPNPPTAPASICSMRTCCMRQNLKATSPGR